MLIDSGSKCYIISDMTRENMKKCKVKVKYIEKNPKIVMTYGSNEPSKIQG